MAVHVGEAEIAAAMTEGQLFVVHAELVQDRSPEIVHRTLVLDNMVAVLAAKIDNAMRGRLLMTGRPFYSGAH